MNALTPDAQLTLDRYLEQLRSALRGHPSVDPDEVERDVLDHIEGELATMPQPVGEARLHSVLERLGSPRRWIPDEELPWWRRTVDRIVRGPEDWRLAYLAFGLLVVGLLVPPLVVLLLPVSFLAARAASAVAAEQGEELGARRWLVYPPLVLIYGLGAVALFLWPVPATLAVGADLTGLTPPGGLGDLGARETVEAWMPLVVRAAGFTGLWWTLLGALGAARPGWVRVVFEPFARSFRRRSAWWLVTPGVVLAVLAILRELS